MIEVYMVILAVAVLLLVIIAIVWVGLQLWDEITYWIWERKTEREIERRNRKNGR